MDKQLKLNEPIEKQITFENIEDHVKPEIKVIKNNYVSAGALIREVIIKKIYFARTIKMPQNV